MSSRDMLVAKIDRLEKKVTEIPLLNKEIENLIEDNDIFHKEIVRLTEFTKQQHETIMKQRKAIDMCDKLNKEYLGQIEAYEVSNKYKHDQISGLDYKLKEANKEIIYYSFDRDRYYKALEKIALVPKGVMSGKRMRLISQEAIIR